MKAFLEAFRRSQEKCHPFGMSWEIEFSFCWVITALVLALVQGDTAPWKWWVLGAMCCSFVGDILLTPRSVFKKIYAGNPIVFGGLMFGVAHLLYAHAFAHKALHYGGYIPRGCWIFGGVLLALAAVALFWHNAQNPPESRKTALTCAILIYAGLICLNCAMIFAAALRAGTVGARLGVVGALSFYVSDAILLCGEIGPRKIDYYDEWIWVFYPIGQILLIVFA